MAKDTNQGKPTAVVDGKTIETKPKLNFNTKKFLKPTAIIVIILVTAGAILGKVFFVQTKESNKPTGHELELLLTSDNNSGRSYVVERYGKKYEAAVEEIRSSDLRKWDKAMLDQAYLSLVYADKVGAFTNVYTTLSLIESAQKNGLNIDDNSWGIDQEKRNAIRQRADYRSQQQIQGSSTGGQNE